MTDQQTAWWDAVADSKGTTMRQKIHWLRVACKEYFGHWQRLQSAMEHIEALLADTDPDIGAALRLIRDVRAQGPEGVQP